MELLILAVPSLLASAIAATVVALLGYGLIALMRGVPYGQAFVTSILVGILVLSPVGFQVWLQGLDVDGPGGLAVFMLWVFVWSTALLSLAFLAGLFLERRSRDRREHRRASS